MSNFGIHGTDLRLVRIAHNPDCPARDVEYDLSDCDGDCEFPTNGDHAETIARRAVDVANGIDDAPAQTWCDRCDLVATNVIPLTTGETAFRCSEHAWLILAPRGAR